LVTPVTSQTCDAFGFYEYGTDSRLNLRTVEVPIIFGSPGFVQRLTNLQPSTQYFFRAVLRDCQGVSRSPISQFATSVLPAGQGAFISSPDSGSSGSGSSGQGSSAGVSSPTSESEPAGSDLMSPELGDSNSSLDPSSSISRRPIVSGDLPDEFLLQFVPGRTVQSSNIGLEREFDIFWHQGSFEQVTNFEVALSVPESLTFVRATDGSFDPISRIFSFRKDVLTFEDAGSITATFIAGANAGDEPILLKLFSSFTDNFGEHHSSSVLSVFETSSVAGDLAEPNKERSGISLRIFLWLLLLFAIAVFVYVSRLVLGRRKDSDILAAKLKEKGFVQKNSSGGSIEGRKEVYPGVSESSARVKQSPPVDLPVEEEDAPYEPYRPKSAD